MPRTTHASQYWENLDNNDLDIKTQLDVLQTTTDIGAKRVAAAQLAQALIRKRNALQQTLDKAHPESDTVPTLTKSINDINKDIDLLKRLQHRLNVGPNENFDLAWRPIDQPPSSCSRHEVPREEEGGRGMEVTESKVGYCNPPKKHQFKSGNPGGPGRPTGSYSLRSLIINELTKRNGRKTRSIVNGLIKRAINGDVRAMVAIWRMTKAPR